MSFVRMLVCYLGVLLAHLGHAMSSDELAKRSECWPERIATRVALTGETHGNTLRAGTEGMLVRIDPEGTALVDFGHNGIFSLSVSDTDVVERAERLSIKRTAESQGLFTFRYTKSFYDPETNRAYQLGDWDRFDRFVLIYLPGELVGALELPVAEFVSSYREQLVSDYKTELCIIPYNLPPAEVTTGSLVSLEVSAPRVVPFHQRGVIHSLQHYPDLRGGIVAIDKNGRILKRIDLKMLQEPRILYERLIEGAGLSET